MWNSEGEGDRTKINHISIFRCENGFGVETTTALGEDGEIRRYIAANLDVVHDLISKYFQGELDG